MAKKSSTVFLCSECGFESGKWLGCCPACGAWNSLSEYTPPKDVPVSVAASLTDAQVMRLNEIDVTETERISTGVSEFDRVLGGGIVPAMAVLIGGDPGIGKSTLLMKTASEITSDFPVLYVSGEESASQLKLRAMRLGANSDMLVLAENSLERVIAEADKIKPKLIIIDSIQTMIAPDSVGAAGSMSQIRECTALLLRYTKSVGTALFIVGHVTKDGAIAGPRTLEHMVDTVLYFEGNSHDSFRLLRAVKNRFGSTNEIGVFEMTDIGIEPVTDTAAIFLSEQTNSGCAVTAALEGTRPMLAEVQSLLSACPFGNPRRMSTGFDNHRLQLLLAVLQQHTPLRLHDKDVYINTVGGIRMDDRSNDLAICMAIASAYCNRPMQRHTAVLGEVGLTGELRAVSRIAVRLNECMRLGFKRVIIPKMNSAKISDLPKDAEVICVSTVREALAKEGLLHGRE